MEPVIGNAATGELLRRAFRILRRNYGCPGADGISLRMVRRHFAEYAQMLERDLSDSSIVFASPRRVSIRTGLVTPIDRVVYVYNVRERWLQCYLRLLIEPILHCRLSDAVFSYRRGRTRYEGLANLVRERPRFVLVLDLRNFFGSICRNRVMQQLNEFGLTASIVELVKAAIDHTENGLPRGNALSPLLANVYLTSLDALFPTHYMRFSDDLLFGVNSPSDAQGIRTRVQEHLRELDLEISEHKTHLFVAPAQCNILAEYPWFNADTVQLET